jgi:sterol desaturase/sphingolipid hydroxylase (fatty acid hydroxylase superfamily)
MNIARSLNNWRKYRQTITELGRMSDRDLRDLGIGREDIRRVALIINMSSIVSNATAASAFPDYAQSGIDFYLHSFWAHMLTSYPSWFTTIVFPFLVLGFTYFVSCSFMFFLEYFFGDFLLRWKIQPDKKNSPEKLWNAVKHLIQSYFTVILPLYASAFFIFEKIGYGFQVSLPIPPWYTILSQLLFFLFVEDFAHYWLHRWLHTDYMYKKVHSYHHEFSAPSSLAASYSHPVEVVVQGLATFLGPFILHPHVVVFYIWVNLRQLTAVETHSGYDFPFSPNHIFPYYGGADFHDFHHRTYNGAYSSNFMWWDMLFGTDNGFWAWKEKQKKRRQEQQKEKDQ